MIILQLAIVLLLGIKPNAMHDIHVSICDIDISDELIEVTLKTFLDDLQIAMGLVPGEELPDDYTSSNEMIDQYVQSRVKFNVNGMDQSININDISASNDAVWITMNVIKTSEELKSLKIVNSFLTEVYDDQTNIVNIKADRNKESYILNKQKHLINYEVEK